MLSKSDSLLIEIRSILHRVLCEICLKVPRRLTFLLWTEKEWIKFWENIHLTIRTQSFWVDFFEKNVLVETLEFKKCNLWKFDDHTSCKAACFSDVNKPFKWEYSASASKLSISLSNFRLAIASVSLKIFSLCRFAFSCNEIYSNWFFYKKLENLLLRRRISFARNFSYGVFFSELLTKNNFTRWNKRKQKKYKNSIHLPCRVSIQSLLVDETRQWMWKKKEITDEKKLTMKKM